MTRAPRDSHFYQIGKEEEALAERRYKTLNPESTRGNRGRLFFLKDYKKKKEEKAKNF